MKHTNMKVIPLTLKEANAFIEQHHRHHKPVRGHRFSLGCVKDGQMVGVAICGRPVARKTNYQEVLEVTRLCTDGTKNACSCLYAACARVAKEMGFLKVQTFILETEHGSSLKASGWILDGHTRGHQWIHTDGIDRRTDQPTCDKHRYARYL
jgi:hypothetical protein